MKRELKARRDADPRVEDAHVEKSFPMKRELKAGILMPLELAPIVEKSFPMKRELKVVLTYPRQVPPIALKSPSL
ncbi:MAG: hypothetical protein OJF51_004916 [Nitrospira sp.]|nr:MAG: hypothetical protein OJF51_004916 [Nitrospira sp.]